MEKRNAKIDRTLCLIVCIGLLLTGCGSESLQKGLSSEVKSAASQVLRTVPAPVLGSVGGEWAVIGLVKSGTTVNEDYLNAYWDSIRASVKGVKGQLTDRYYTTYARLTIALCAIGKDPTDVEGYDIAAPLDDYDKVVRQGMNAASFALIASQVSGIPLTHEADYIRYLLDKNREEEIYKDPRFSDYTAMTMQALAYYKQQPEVAAFLDLCVAALSDIQQPTGDFDNCESTAECIIALTAQGIDPFTDSRFIKNGISLGESLLHFKDGKRYVHQKGAEGFDEQMPQEKALLALDALSAFTRGEKLYQPK